MSDDISLIGKNYKKNINLSEGKRRNIQDQTSSRQSEQITVEKQIQELEKEVQTL